LSAWHRASRDSRGAVDAVNVVEMLELFGLEMVGLLQDSEKMGDGTKGIAREVEIFGR